MDRPDALDAWIVRPRPNSLARLRLFCIPIAGGNASSFQDWPDLLPEHIEVCAIQFPGRQQRAQERPYTRMPLAVQDVERAVRPYLDRPFAVFGTCTGSLVGYELARRLRRTAGVRPAALLASCCRAPHLPDRDRPIHALPEPDLWREIERLGGTPDVVLRHPDLKAMLSPVLRADFELAETYQYRSEAPLDCPLAVFGGRHDTIVAPEELAGWREHTTGPFAIRMLDGGHYLLDGAQRPLLEAVAALCA